ncbi:hypothetical protein [Neobacillus sp. LXY-4]|uniref:hypothetical protein n=1 Tax=Neobacillus sp. LXY-4 TaxID=3379826 RepID=UPI003EE238A6
MKHLYFFLVLTAVIVSFLHVGNHGRGTQMTERVQAAQVSPVNIPNNHIPDDHSLTGPGQTVRGHQGELTLLARKPVYDAYHLGGVALIINEVKVMHFIPNVSERDFFNSYTTAKEFDFIKIDIEIVNENPKTVQFNPIETIQIGNESISLKDLFGDAGMTGLIEGGETKTGQLCFIKNNDANVDKIEIATSDVVGVNEEILNEAIELEINMGP